MTRSFICMLLIASLAGCVSVSSRWKDTRRLDTISGYESFIREFPQTEYVPIARERIEQIRFERATKRGTIAALEVFLKEYPTGKHASAARVAIEAARAAIEKLHWQKASNADTPKAYAEFVASHPASSHAQKASQLAAAAQSRDSFFDSLTKLNDAAEIRRRVASKKAKKYVTVKTISRLERLLAAKLTTASQPRFPAIKASEGSNKGSVTISNAASSGRRISVVEFGGSAGAGRGNHLIRLTDGTVLRMRTEFSADSIPLSAKSRRVSDWRPAFPDAVGSIHRFEGMVTLGGYTFVGEGGSLDRLTFLLTKSGYVYLRGKGMVRTPKAAQVIFPTAKAASQPLK